MSYGAYVIPVEDPGTSACTSRVPCSFHSIGSTIVRELHFSCITNKTLGGAFTASFEHLGSCIGIDSCRSWSFDRAARLSASSYPHTSINPNPNPNPPAVRSIPSSDQGSDTAANIQGFNNSTQHYLLYSVFTPCPPFQASSFFIAIPLAIPHSCLTPYDQLVFFLGYVSATTPYPSS
jgi:hypothetical protein